MKARRIDYRRVPELAAAGLPYDAIAKEIGCSYSVLFTPAKSAQQTFEVAA